MSHKILFLRRRRGFILLLTLIFMTVLTVMTGAFMYMMTCQGRAVAPQRDEANMAGLADAGIEKAYREISDDYSGSAPSPGSATGVADLRGATSSPTNMQYIDGTYATISTGAATVSVFDSNYTNTRIVSVVPHIVASRQTGGSGATIQFSYSTNGGSSYTTVLTQVLPNSSTLVDYAGTAISGLTWSQIMSTNFILRATRTSGNRNVYIDAMYLRVTYGIDTLKERWATGGYATFPISLSNGTIQSVSVTDEQGKIHLNYASAHLLTNLLTNLGITNASTKATNIVNYRGATLTNPFDSVEELQLVTGITPSDYAAIKNYVTVYSFTNTNVYRPNTSPPTPFARAPININTADPVQANSPWVLKSIFDSLGLGAGDSTSLANDIRTQRSTAPFVGFYTSASTTNYTYFYNFVNSRSYLTATEKNIVIDNCDASSLIPVSGYAGYNCDTTELCYAGYAFMVNSLGNYHGRNMRIKTIVGNDGSNSFYTYRAVTMPPKVGWRKENFE